jgi:hypothetical protein
MGEKGKFDEPLLYASFLQSPNELHGPGITRETGWSPGGKVMMIIIILLVDLLVQ